MNDTSGASEPATQADLRGLLLDYLDFYRGVVVEKARGLDPDELGSSRVPSGWTILGLLNHLVHMERRWLQWGFLAEPLDAPWGDDSGAGWVTPQVSVDEMAARLACVGRRTREIVERHALDDVARVGGRFGNEAEAPHLHWILLHVVQEYARHAGHLDIGRELVDASTGEQG